MKPEWSKGALRRLDGLRHAPERVHPQDLASKAVSPKSGAIVAASALAVAAWQEYEHRRVSRADLTESHVRVERLSDIKDDKAALEAIDSALQAEWGPFALLGFASMKQMANEAGPTIFIARRVVEGALIPVGAVQTLLADAHGDPDLLTQMYPSFAALTDKKTWKQSRTKGGDTAVLLQITTFDSTARGGGLGSTLRNALLHMLPKEVRYALTTTPVDIEPGAIVKLDDKETYSPAMRFHARGGARPSAYLPNYKLSRDGQPTNHGTDVVIMRYERDADGIWPAARPDMRVRRSGPLQRRLALATRRLSRLPGRGKLALVQVRPGRFVSAAGVARRGHDIEALVTRAYRGARKRIARGHNGVTPPDSD